MPMKTAAVIVIDEEQNQSGKCGSSGKFLLQELNNLGYDVAKVAAVADEESAIVNELDWSIKSVDVVVTVCEKCAALFGAVSGMISQELERSEELVRILKEIQEPHDTDDVRLPVQAKLIRASDAYPVVHFQRIFMLKEKHLRRSFDAILKNHLAEYRKANCFTKTVHISHNGNSAADLSDIKQITSNGVTVELSRSDHSFMFKFSSSQIASMIEFQEKIRNQFHSFHLRFVDDSNVWDSVYSDKENHVQNAIETIERCLKEFGLENVFLSFNGGKDCTVLLHLVLTVMKKKYPHYNEPILCLYVQSEESFPEQEEFITQSGLYYNLQVITIRSEIKVALEETLKKHPNYKACFMGTRRTDPYSSELNSFQMTDPNWPQIMRISPLLDWHYSDVWDYLLYYKVPYCSLYDLGYTSLGNTANTTRNPSLVYFDESLGREVCLPAYKLLKETTERRGRK